MGKNSIKTADASIQKLVSPEGMTPSRCVSSGQGLYVLAAVLTLWLCGWAAGWGKVADRLAQGTLGPDAAPFLWVWLGGWTIGGLIFIGVLLAVLWRLISPDRPPSVGSLDNKRQHSTEGICTPDR
jgi:hypothetical protein